MYETHETHTPASDVRGDERGGARKLCAVNKQETFILFFVVALLLQGGRQHGSENSRDNNDNDQKTHGFVARLFLRVVDENETGDVM